MTKNGGLMFVGRENELKILIAYFHQTGKNLY